MLRIPASAPSCYCPNHLLLVGLLAIILHLIIGTGLVRAGVPDARGFVPELCSKHGLVNPGSTDKLPGDGHDCCKLCAAGLPPLLPVSTIELPYPSSYIDAGARHATAAPTAAFASAHRPRGPPADT